MSNIDERRLFLKDANDFRAQRIEHIKSSEATIDTYKNGVVIVHIVPSTFSSLTSLSFSDENKLVRLTTKLLPLGTGSGSSLWNFDGYRMANGNGYTQLFRNGALECCSNVYHSVEKGVFDLGDFERDALEQIINALPIYSAFDIEPSFGVLISFSGIKGRRVFANRVIGNIRNFDTDELFFPGCEICGIEDDVNASIAKQMMDTFDMLWQSAGVTKSPYYKAGGDRW